MSELFTYGIDTIEKETKMNGIKNVSQPSCKLFVTKFQLDFLSHIIWLPFQVCQLL
jgi:hypothetical protein